MSFGIHRLWKDYFVNSLQLRRSTNMIDVAGGTGDIAFRALRQIQTKSSEGSVTVVDINQVLARFLFKMNHLLENARCWHVSSRRRNGFR